MATATVPKLDTKLWALIREAAERALRDETDRQEITGKHVRAVVYRMEIEPVPMVRIDLRAIK